MKDKNGQTFHVNDMVFDDHINPIVGEVVRVYKSTIKVKYDIFGVYFYATYTKEYCSRFLTH